MCLKRSLHSYPMRNFPHRKSRINPSVPFSYDYTFVCLQTLSAALSYPDLNNNSISRAKFGMVMFDLACFNIFYNFVFTHLSALHSLDISIFLFDIFRSFSVSVRLFKRSGRLFEVRSIDSVFLQSAIF